MAHEELATYAAYGLSIRSEVPLPELPEAEPPVDIEIRRAEVTPHPETLDENGRGFWIRGSEACHAMRGAGAFLVREGREILVDQAPDADDRVVRLSLLGPAMGLALHQRGHLVLHASAVASGGRAIAFVGGHALGKSMTAALLHARGYRIVTDDVCALVREDSQPRVLPSFPQLKLWPDAVQNLGLEMDQLPRLHPTFEKRALRPAEGFSDSPATLERLYVLGVGNDCAVHPIPPSDAVKMVLIHWYGHRFGQKLFRELDLPAHFRRCLAVARSVPACALLRPGDILESRDSQARFAELLVEETRRTLGSP